MPKQTQLPVTIDELLRGLAQLSETLLSTCEDLDARLAIINKRLNTLEAIAVARHESLVWDSLSVPGAQIN